MFGLMTRTTTDVLQDHLVKRLVGDVDGDIAANFADDILILSSFGVFKGRDGVRESAATLQRLVGEAVFHYNRTLIEGDYGFLDWSAESDHTVVRDGADSFVVEGGKIVLQTIHYTVRDRN
jgi:hypothetical protein